jgi:cytochrome c5
MSKRLMRAMAPGPVLLALSACVGSPASAPAHAPVAGGMSGEQAYREVCMACHEAGVADAPRLGDRKAWEGLIDEGQAVLTAHGWVGVRGMPARGGSPDLTLVEFARATAFMARAAGGDWLDPDQKMLDRIRHEEKERLEDLEKKKAKRE